MAPMITFQNCMKITDGLGVCSPGRWRPRARALLSDNQQLEHARQVREILLELVHKEISDVRKASFQLALGHFSASPFSLENIDQARRKLASILPEPDAAMDIPTGQPFMLHM